MTALAALLLVARYSCWGAHVQSLRTARRSFVIKNDRFRLNGDPLNVRSGSMHYSRVPRQYWRDRLERAKALGLNAITTYVPWNFHEDVEGRFDFAEDRDVYAFADAARKLDLLLILRIGPYMFGAVWKSNFGRPTTSSPQLHLLDGVEILRHRRDVLPLAAAARWRGGSRRSPMT